MSRDNRTGSNPPSPRKTGAAFTVTAEKKSTHPRGRPKLKRASETVIEKDTARPAERQPSKSKQIKEAEMQQARDFLKGIQEALQRVEKEKNELAQTNLRLIAEIQTLRRRSATETVKAHQEGIIDLMKCLADTLDNLERALATTDATNDKTVPREGVQLTYTSLLNCLATFDITPIDPQGEPFDPQCHEAIGKVKVEDKPPNTVVQVMQKGYRLGEHKLIRPARVLVSQ